MHRNKNNKGITLISLVVTIIVLLILSGVTITMITGDNGIIKRAGSAKKQYEVAKDKEIINLALTNVIMSSVYKNYTAEEMAIELSEYNISNYSKRGNNTSLTLNGKDYRVKPNGEVIEYTYMEPTSICYKMEVNGTLRLKANDSSYTQGTNWDKSAVTKIIIEEPIAPDTTIARNIFSESENLEEIENMKYLHTENVTSMENMFLKCKSLKHLDVSYFDTYQVTSMKYMFYWCVNLESLDVGSFDTSNVKDMRGMFGKCWDEESNQMKLSNISGLDKFNTSQVENMAEMFNYCSYLNEIDVSNFNTSNVTSMYFMFANCNNLIGLNLRNFNTEKVQTMERMFGYCYSIKELDISSFNTKNVTNMDHMFIYDDNLKTIYVSNKFITNKVSSAIYMFFGCPIVGGAGTTYIDSTITYACIDNPPDHPGYFTLKQ